MTIWFKVHSFKKLIMKYLKCAIAILFVLGCCKKESIILPSQKTKIKRIYIYPDYRTNPLIADTFKYDFIYDVTFQKLIEVRRNDSDYIKISNLNQNFNLPCSKW